MLYSRERKPTQSFYDEQLQKAALREMSLEEDVAMVSKVDGFSIYELWNDDTPEHERDRSRIGQAANGMGSGNSNDIRNKSSIGKATANSHSNRRHDGLESVNKNSLPWRNDSNGNGSSQFGTWPPPTPQRSIPCPWPRCGKVFEASTGLNSHMRAHRRQSRGSIQFVRHIAGSSTRYDDLNEDDKNSTVCRVRSGKTGSSGGNDSRQQQQQRQRQRREKRRRYEATPLSGDSGRIPPYFLCPITGKLMREAVILTSTGQSYDRHAIEPLLAPGKEAELQAVPTFQSAAFVAGHSERAHTGTRKEENRPAVPDVGGARSVLMSFADLDTEENGLRANLQQAREARRFTLAANNPEGRKERRREGDAKDVDAVATVTKQDNEAPCRKIEGRNSHPDTNLWENEEPKKEDDEPALPMDVETNLDSDFDKDVLHPPISLEQSKQRQDSREQKRGGVGQYAQIVTTVAVDRPWVPPNCADTDSGGGLPPLLPNYMLRRLIYEWCMSVGLEPPPATMPDACGSRLLHSEREELVIAKTAAATAEAERARERRRQEREEHEERQRRRQHHHKQELSGAVRWKRVSSTGGSSGCSATKGGNEASSGNDSSSSEEEEEEEVRETRTARRRRLMAEAAAAKQAASEAGEGGRSCSTSPSASDGVASLGSEGQGGSSASCTAQRAPVAHKSGGSVLSPVPAAAHASTPPKSATSPKEGNWAIRRTFGRSSSAGGSPQGVSSNEEADKQKLKPKAKQKQKKKKQHHKKDGEEDDKRKREEKMEASVSAQKKVTQQLEPSKEERFLLNLNEGTRVKLTPLNGFTTRAMTTVELREFFGVNEVPLPPSSTTPPSKKTIKNATTASVPTKVKKRSLADDRGMVTPGRAKDKKGGDAATSSKSDIKRKKEINPKTSKKNGKDGTKKGSSSNSVSNAQETSSTAKRTKKVGAVSATVSSNGAKRKRAEEKASATAATKNFKKRSRLSISLDTSLRSSKSLVSSDNNASKNENENENEFEFEDDEGAANNEGEDDIVSQDSNDDEDFHLGEEDHEGTFKKADVSDND